jgi:hypothetical protein|tara:strand:+ start:193 stop:381 length:189 start_codon:yes stop_codon:yes gene_type:complete
MSFTEEQLEVIKWLLDRESKHIKEIYNAMLRSKDISVDHINETTDRLEKINEIIRIIEKGQA